MSDRSDPAGADGEPMEEEDSGVLDPDDLDIRERDGVHERGEGRYVISTEGGGAAVDDGPAETNPDPRGVEPTPSGEDGDESEDGAVGEDDRGRPHLDALAAELEGLSAPYGLALAGKAGDDTASVQVAGGDPAAVLGAAVRWYAAQVDSRDSVDETVDALLADAGLGGEA